MRRRFFCIDIFITPPIAVLYHFHRTFYFDTSDIFLFNITGVNIIIVQ